MSCLREWLSGGAPPCQGGGRGFDPRLALLLIKRTSKWEVLFLLSEKCGALLDTQLLRSLSSISRGAKAPLGRASAKVHWTLWHPARALLDNKKDFRIGSPFLLSEKCGALLDTQLLCSLGSISRDAKAPLGRACAKVHRTLWHPSRALVKKSCHTNLINQCDSPNFNYKFLYILLILFN